MSQKCHLKMSLEETIEIDLVVFDGRKIQKKKKEKNL